LNIVTAMSDPNVFAAHFRDTKSWTAWKSFLAALFGLKMSEEQLNIFRQCTGRDTAPDNGVNEAWLTPHGTIRQGLHRSRARLA
jgi:hypothetical protein